MMNGWGFGSGMGWGSGIGIVSLLLLGGLIIGGIFFVKWLTRDSGKKGIFEDELEAMEMLKSRYAKGEISKDEFQQIKADLEDLQL